MDETSSKHYSTTQHGVCHEIRVYRVVQNSPKQVTRKSGLHLVRNWGKSAPQVPFVTMYRVDYWEFCGNGGVRYKGQWNWRTDEGSSVFSSASSGDYDNTAKIDRDPQKYNTQDTKP